MPVSPRSVPPPHPSAPDDFLDRAERALETYTARVILSLLIVISVLPPESRTAEFLGHEQIRNWFFFCVFAAEFALRVAIHLRRRDSRGFGEPLLLMLDLVAVLSFLPWETVTEDLAMVRLIRLSRIILLLGYWRSMVSDLWSIFMSRERRFQVSFVLFTGFVLAFSSAVILHRMDFQDPDGDGNVEFYDTLWWTFRQVQDPGNLVSQPESWPIVIASMLLTFVGLILFAFFVGTGTTAIEELMARSRTRPVGLRQHTVILGLGEHSHFLLRGVRGHLPARTAVPCAPRCWVPTSCKPPAMAERSAGSPSSTVTGDPVRVRPTWTAWTWSVRKRVLILGTDAERTPTPAVVAATLALRDRNAAGGPLPGPRAREQPGSRRTHVPAARATHVVGSGSFVGNYIAQNVANPGIYRLYRQLLTSAGCEIYTYVFYGDDAPRMRSNAGPDAALDWRELQSRARRDHGVTLLGYFVAPPGDGDVAVEELDVLLAPRVPGGPDYARLEDGRVRADAVRGLIGVALRWDDVRALGESLIARPVRAAPDAYSVFEKLEPLRLVPTGRGVKRVTIVGGSRRIPNSKLPGRCRPACRRKPIPAGGFSSSSRTGFSPEAGRLPASPTSCRPRATSCRSPWRAARSSWCAARRAPCGPSTTSAATAA